MPFSGISEKSVWYNTRMTTEIRKLLERISESFVGCDCECIPKRTDEDGNEQVAHECLPCAIKRALAQ